MEKINLLDLPVSELKRQLVTGKDLQEVMRFFFDHFAERQGFLEAGRPVKVPEDLAQGVAPLISKVWPNGNTITKWAIAEVALLGLIHGTIVVEKTTAILLWARDVSTGIVAIPNGKPGGMLYARITISAKPTVTN